MKKRPKKRYRATIRLDGRKITLGYFDTETERQAAHDKAVAEYTALRPPAPKCVDCDADAMPDSFGRCRLHLQLLRRERNGEDDTPEESFGYTEWCRARGYDPVTRTYTSDEPTPEARLDIDWLNP